MTPQQVRSSEAKDAQFRIVPAGDSALIIELPDRLDPEVNRRAVAIAASLRAAALAGVQDVTATYRSVAIYFNPLRTDSSQLVDIASELAERTTPEDSKPAAPIRVPVCYGGEFGPDLAAVAASAGMSEADVVALHASRPYRVFMLGFLPGFTYMGTVDARIMMPRLAEPRPRVEAGSVGIAGLQTGIYPSPTPGGWRIVGRTPLKPFDPERAEPFLFSAGDIVEFYPVEVAEFARARASR